MIHVRLKEQPLLQRCEGGGSNVGNIRIPGMKIHYFHVCAGAKYLHKVNETALAQEVCL